MSRYLISIIIIIVTSVTALGAEIEKPHVAVLPFKILAEKDPAGLGEEVVEIISDLLTNQGASIVNSPALMDSIPDEGFESTGEVKKFGKQAQADYVIQGSISMIGEGYSIDTKLITVKGD